MKVLITGSHGFVGRNFVRRLVADGHDVTGVDNLEPGGGGLPMSVWERSIAGSGTFREERTDATDWFRRNPGEHFDLAVHLAAIVGGRAVIEGDPMAVARDLALDAEFWRWAVASSPGHVISFSSSAAYPVSLQREDSPEKLLEELDLNFRGSLGMPDLTYGWAKLTNEYLGTIASANYGLKVATYRPFSGYGSDQDPSYPFPAICRRAYFRVTNDDGKFFVWGSGRQKRDFVHIFDVIDCCLNTYSRITDGSALNISSGILTSFRELAALACETQGWDVEIVGTENTPEGVFARGGSTTRQIELGFQPKISLQEGVQMFMEDLAQVQVR